MASEQEICLLVTGLLFMCMYVAGVSLCASCAFKSPQRPDKDIGYPGTGVAAVVSYCADTRSELRSFAGAARALNC